MFFNKKDKNNLETNFVKIGALLIYAAKIDENYSKEEEEIVKKTLLSLGANKTNLLSLITKAKQCEEDANQILEFTKEVKNKNIDEKKIVIEALWNIIYSDEDADIYETNLMRRLSGLLYLDPKIVGDIKEKIKSKQ